MTSAPAAAKFRRILAPAAVRWRGLLVIAVLAVMSSMLAALLPWPLKFLVDSVLAESPQQVPFLSAAGLSAVSLVALAAAASLAIHAAQSLLDAAQTMLWSRTGLRMVYDLASRMFGQLQRLSLGFHARSSVGDSLTRLMDDSWCVFSVTESLLLVPVRELIVILSVSVLAWHLEPQLTLLMLIALPALAASAFHFGHLLKHAELRKRKAAARLTAFVHQTLGAMPLVHTFATADRNQRLFGELARQSIAATRSGAAVGQSYQLVNALATTIGIAMVIYLGGRSVAAGTMTVGSLLVFIAYVRTLESSCLKLLQTYALLRGSEASVDRVFEVMDAQEMVRDAADARDLPPRAAGACGKLVFDRVSFGHVDERPVLRDLSLLVKPGETLALVGHTGAGKSTLAGLVPRFFDPSSGRILLDDAELQTIRLASLRSEIALVLQDPFLLPISIAENIAYGRPDASRDDIVAAASAAHAHDFIRELDAGYDTLLGEQGADLSGGQRQRIAIARALLMDPRLLILDEPTAALDAGTEGEVLAALSRLMQGRTTLIIAHRPATMRLADRIAVLDEGHIAEIGTHDELIALGNRYARLCDLGGIAAAPRVPR